MKTQCSICAVPMSGRSDKKYCSDACKNAHHNELRSPKADIVREIDLILHKNRDILKTLMQNAKNTKITIDRLVLEQAGFNFDRFTGIYTNSQNKTYYYLYDYAWMAFSLEKTMIVRK